VAGALWSFPQVVREGEGIRTTPGGIFKLDPRNEVQTVLNERIVLFTSTHNEDPPGGDWFLACEIRLPFSPINWRPRTRRIRAIRVESELRFTVRESQSQGFGASLDAPEGSMLPKTLLPGA
jgi:hypothetical protein